MGEIGCSVWLTVAVLASAVNVVVSYMLSYTDPLGRLVTVLDK